MKIDDFSITRRNGCFDSALYDVASITETMLFEVLSISRPCEVGEIDRNKRI